MEKIILAISGMPVSGKSTTIQEIIEQLKKKGYKEEDIHLISTGAKFRQYFNKVTQLIQNIDNAERIQEIVNDEELKRIFNVPEYNVFYHNFSP